MERLILDTNILIQIVRGNKTGKEVKSFIDQIKDPRLFISVVNIAESDSLVAQWNWPANKIEKLKRIISSFVTIDIEQNNQLLLDAYVNIDAFSQGRNAAPSGQFLNNSSRNMGKNDLWVAATFYVIEATLLTTNGDFDHLNNVFFDVKKF